MKNYESSGSRIVQVDEKNNIVPFIHNEDYTMIVVILSKLYSYGKLFATGRKIWDSSSDPIIYTFKIKYITKQDVEPDLNSISVGEQVVIHRVGEFDGIGNAGFEYHVKDASKVSWVTYITPPAEVMIKARVAWDIQEEEDFSLGELVTLTEVDTVEPTGTIVWIDYYAHPPHLESAGNSCIYRLRLISENFTRTVEGNPVVHNLYAVEYLLKKDLLELDLNVVEGILVSARTAEVYLGKGMEPYYTEEYLETSIGGVQKKNRVPALIDLNWVGAEGEFKWARITSTFPLIISPIQPMMADPANAWYISRCLLTTETVWDGAGDAPETTISSYTSYE